MLKNEKLNNLLHAQSIRRRLNSYNFAADCLMDDGQSFLMVPSEAIAMALTQGRLNKDFNLFIDGDKARRQEKLIREYEKKMDEEVKFLDKMFGGIMLVGVSRNES